MGPQLYRCGNMSVLVLALNSCTASMGPQLYRCGNMLRPSPTCELLSRTLQWGRNFIVAEMLDCGIKRYASSPKLQWGRNFIVAEIAGNRRRLWLISNASMGPQLYRCGNALPGFACPCGSNRLQWGRNFIVAEICGRYATGPPRSASFNGAATLSLRK